MQLKSDEKKKLVDFKVLPVILMTPDSDWGACNTDLINIASNSEKVIIAMVGFKSSQIEALKQLVEKSFLKMGWSKSELNDISFVAILDNWFGRIQASSDEDKRWFTIAHLYSDIIRIKEEYKDKRFTHILWSFDPSKNNIKKLYEASKESYSSEEYKILFKNKSEGMPDNFCTYLYGQNFITIDMYKSNDEESYKGVIDNEV